MLWELEKKFQNMSGLILHIALREAQKEKEKIFSILINNAISPEITNMANEKIELLTQEIDTIQDQLTIIKYQCDDSEIYEMALDMIKNLQNFSVVLNEPEQDKTKIRQAFLSNINKVKITNEDKYIIYPAYGEGSTKGIEWYAQKGSSIVINHPQNPLYS